MRPIFALPFAALALCCATPAAAQEAGQPLWIRHAEISPNGEKIAFTFRGRIFTVAADGGAAQALTPEGHYSHDPVWTPDSTEIAFASDVNGDDDVYLTDSRSGEVRRITWTSHAEVPHAFSPDGGTIVYTSRGLGDPVASQQSALTGKPKLYQVELTEGRRRLLMPLAADQGKWSRDGKRLAYVYDPSTDPGSRQHRVPGNARQIWSFDPLTGWHQLLAGGEHDALDPVWGPGGDTLYYLGEQSGTLNVWRLDLETGANTQLTHYEEYPVRFLSISDAGDLAFFHSGSLHVLRAGGSVPESVAVSFPQQRMDEQEGLAGFETTEFVSSPDGAYIATVIGGEVFLHDRSGGTRRLTESVAPEMNVSFSPDSGTLLFAAQKDRIWGIYGVDLERAEAGDGLAPGYDVRPFVVGDENAFAPQFSPDGTKIAYVHARREIRVLDLATGETSTPFTPEDYVTSYQDGDIWFSWSPDSHYLLTSWKTVPFSAVTRAGIVPADGSEPVRAITEAIPEIAGAMFSADGTQILALTPLYSLRTLDQGSQHYDIYRIFLSDEARADFWNFADGGEAPAGGYRFQPERNSYLERRLTQQSASYLNAFPLGEGNPAILSVAIDLSGQVSAVEIDLTNGGIREIVPLGDVPLEAVGFASEAGILDVKTPEGVLSIPLANPDECSFMPVSVEVDIDADERRRMAFEQIWANVKHKFYRADVEGRDWDRIGAYYSRYLDSIATDRELSKLVDEMFGEISASHLFVSYNPPQRPGTETAALGFFHDHTHRGEGVKVAALLPGGPLDLPGMPVQPGDIIVSVNGEPLRAEGGLDRALDGLAYEAVEIGFARGESDEEITVSAIPVALFDQAMLNHQRWIDTRRALVTRRSRGCIVYQYVPMMDNDAYVSAYGRLITARDRAKAALIDIRANGGGNLHRQLITLLSGEPYAMVGREGRQWDSEPLNRWTKPSALIVDSLAYSDGSIFPQVYRDAGVGEVVGDRLVNTGTGVNYIESPLIKGLNYGIPVQPFRFLDGTYYENHDFVPDILVPRDPNALMHGEDPKLDAGIDLLMKGIGGGECR